MAQGEMLERVAELRSLVAELERAIREGKSQEVDGLCCRLRNYLIECGPSQGPLFETLDRWVAA